MDLPPTTPPQYIDLVAQGEILESQTGGASEAGIQSGKEGKKHGAHGVGRLAVGAVEHQQFQHGRSYW
jgi:hypothetical protein